MALDPVGTAGHLVSMVVTDGIVNAPIALLANHMHSSLAAAVAKEGSEGSGLGEVHFLKAFLMHFLARKYLKLE